jgi:hypothetical protein
MHLGVSWVTNLRNAICGYQKKHADVLSWRWKQNLLPKDLYPRIKLHDIVIEVGGGWKEYVGQCNRNERTALDWLRTGIWKLWGLQCGVERGTWPIGRTEENAVHKLLNYPKTQRRRKIFTERKWLKIKKEMAFWENCGGATKLPVWEIWGIIVYRCKLDYRMETLWEKEASRWLQGGKKFSLYTTPPLPHPTRWLHSHKDEQSPVTTV